MATVGLEQLTSATNEVVSMLRRNNAETLEVWRNKYDEKINLIIARRLVRLEIILEGRNEDREVELEAYRRATDKKPLEDMLKIHIDDFNTIEEDTISELMATTAEQDTKFYHELQAMDTTDQSARERHLTALLEERKRSLWSLNREHSLLNIALLMGIDDIDIDSIEEEALGSLTFEDYCFSKKYSEEDG